MTTDAEVASATVITPDAGTVTATNDATTQGSTTGVADPFAALDTDTRDWVGKAGLKDVAALAAKARNAESLIGRSVQLPAADAKPEEWAKVYDRLGRPKDANGFEFKPVDGLPADFAYDGEREKVFKSDAYAAGLTQKQAALLRDAEVKRNADAFAELQKEVATQAATATAALEKAWGGAKDSESYKAGMGMAARALSGLDRLPGVTGLQKALEGAGVLMADGNGGSIIIEPTIAVALAEIGKRLFKEDGFVTGGAANASDNPFVKGGNQTVQMQMIANDRAKALQLMSAAGRTPTEFGLS